MLAPAQFFFTGVLASLPTGWQAPANRQRFFSAWFNASIRG
jgi:hypothetical protein